MNKTATRIEQRPNYYRGQLLLEDDFLAEQNYHAGARRRHNLQVHGWGVADGLEVTSKTASSIEVSAGYAIEATGQEVFLKESQEVDLKGFGPNDVIRVSLKYEDSADSADGETAQQKSCDVYALITLARATEGSTGVTLATIKLDGQGNVTDEGIDYNQTKYIKVLGPGSVTSEDLHQDLKTGWLRVPFRPVPAVEWQKDQKGIPPFRVGRTEALSWDSANAGDKDRGAWGTMEIAVPPGASRITQLRIAGKENHDKIVVILYKGGWDQSEMKHYKEEILKKEINDQPYSTIFDIEAEKSAIDPEFQTLSLELRGMKRTSVSLIAVEFVYWKDKPGSEPQIE